VIHTLLHAAYDVAMSTPDDPWSALQKPGSEVTDQHRQRIAPAYATFDDRNRPVVGFDVAMKLPAVCVKCGTATDTELVLPIRIEDDLLGQMIVDRLEGPVRNERMQPGKFLLGLPYCTQCMSRKKLAIALRAALYAAPLFFLLVLVAAVLIHQSLTGPVLIATLVLWPALVFFSKKMWKTGMVDIGQLDSDGFIRITGVHPDAGEAIVAASSARPSA
jgi:hypothetical protein